MTSIASVTPDQKARILANVERAAPSIYACPNTFQEAVLIALSQDGLVVRSKRNANWWRLMPALKRSRRDVYRHVPRRHRRRKAAAVKLSKSTLERIERQIEMAVSDPIWEQAEDFDVSEDESVRAADEARHRMIEALRGVDLGCSPSLTAKEVAS